MVVEWFSDIALEIERQHHFLLSRVPSVDPADDGALNSGVRHRRRSIFDLKVHGLLFGRLDRLAGDAAEEWDAGYVQGFSAWHAHYAGGEDQRRPAGIPQELKLQPEIVSNALAHERNEVTWILKQAAPLRVIARTRL